MTDTVPQRRRRWPWVVAVVLVVAAIPATYIIASVTGPSPRLGQIEQEPILVAPIVAVELGRATRQSQYGVGLPNVSAYVVVAYQVDATPQEALDAWATAYGQRYELKTLDTLATLTLTGSTEDVTASVMASDRVAESVTGGEFKAPVPGSTVVTVDVSGKG